MPNASASAGAAEFAATERISVKDSEAPVPNASASAAAGSTAAAPVNDFDVSLSDDDVSNASASVAAGSTAAAPVNDFGVSSSDDEDVDKDKTDITDEAAWQDALTIMMFYERLSGQTLGAANWFDASIEPKLRLTQAQRKVIASLCEQLLFGFRTEGATEHERETCEPMTAAKNLTLLITTMKTILEHRARFFPEEKQLTETEVSKVYTDWMHEWLRTKLRDDQLRKTTSQKTSIFNAYVKKTFGGKAFVIAVLQCGSTLMPSGAAEHAHKYRNNETRTIACLEELVDWLARFGAAYVGHKKDPATQKAREYSGSACGQSGLTAEQQQLRLHRHTVQKRLRQAITLQREVRAYTNWDYREFRCPRGWFQLAHWEQEVIQALERGDLNRECDDAAAAHGGAVAARPFRM